MDDDSELMDGVRGGLPDNINDNELTALFDENFGQIDMDDFSGTLQNFESLGTTTAFPWAHSSVQPSNTANEISNLRIINSLGNHEANFTASSSGRDVAPAYISHDSDFIAPFTSEKAILGKNQTLIMGSERAFSTFDMESRSAENHHTRQKFSVPEDVGHSSLKKRKTTVQQESGQVAQNTKIFSSLTVLNLLFRFTQDLTMTQMIGIAEETGYSSEYVVNSYLQYRTAASNGRGVLGNASLMPGSSDASMQGSRSSIRFDTSDTGKTGDSEANNELNQDTHNEEEQYNKTLDPLENTGLDKEFKCTKSGCPRSFLRQGDLNRHLKMHFPGKYPCDFPDCGRVYYRKDKLRQHWEKEHANSPLPPHLSSSRPKRDPDQDGNSRSNGSSNNELPKRGGKSQDQLSDGRSSHTLGSSGSSSVQGSYNRFSENRAESGQVIMDCKNDEDDETDKYTTEVTENTSHSIYSSDTESKTDLEGRCSTACEDTKSEAAQRHDLSEPSQSLLDDLALLDLTRGAQEPNSTFALVPSSTSLQTAHTLSKPSRMIVDDSLPGLHSEHMRNLNESPTHKIIKSQQISDWMKDIGPKENFQPVGFGPSEPSRQGMTSGQSSMSTTPITLPNATLEGSTTGIKSRSDQSPNQCRVESQKISSWIGHVAPMETLFEELSHSCSPSSPRSLSPCNSRSFSRSSRSIFSKNSSKCSSAPTMPSSADFKISSLDGQLTRNVSVKPRGSVVVFNQYKRHALEGEPRSSDARSSDYHKSARRCKQ